ncbi:zinc finger, CCHC-type containing protein [Tanacetum coccineum]
MDCMRKQAKVTTRGSQVKARTEEMSLQTLELGLVLIDTEGKTYVMRYTSSHHPGAYRSTRSMNTKTKLTNQADKYVYRKFDESSKRVIICLYVDDMLIFGTNQVKADLTKEFLSSRFSMKDMGETDVILGIRIKHESNGISTTSIDANAVLSSCGWMLVTNTTKNLQ